MGSLRAVPWFLTPKEVTHVLGEFGSRRHNHELVSVKKRAGIGEKPGQDGVNRIRPTMLQRSYWAEWKSTRGRGEL